MESALKGDEASCSAKYISLDDKQELVIPYLAFRATSEEVEWQRGYFRIICDTDVSQISVPYEYVLWACPAKARR